MLALTGEDDEVYMGYQPTRDPPPLPTRLDAAKAAFVRLDFVGLEEVEAFEAQVERLLADGVADAVHFPGLAPPPKPADSRSAAVPFATEVVAR